MTDIKTGLTQMLDIDGTKCAAIVDSQSGMILGQEGSGLDMELAAAGNSEVVKAKLRTMDELGIEGEIEDILLTLSDQYHIIRPMAKQPGVFIYLVLNRAKANLALARRKVQNIEDDLEL